MVELLPTISKVHGLLPRTTKQRREKEWRENKGKEGKNGKSARGGYGEGNREKILNMRHINAI